MTWVMGGEDGSDLGHGRGRIQLNPDVECAGVPDVEWERAYPASDVERAKCLIAPTKRFGTSKEHEMLFLPSPHVPHPAAEPGRSGKGSPAPHPVPPPPPLSSYSSSVFT